MESILADCQTLGADTQKVTYTSDYFPQMLKLAELLIKAGHLYADDSTQEIMKEVLIFHRCLACFLARTALLAYGCEQNKMILTSNITFSKAISTLLGENFDEMCECTCVPVLTFKGRAAPCCSYPNRTTDSTSARYVQER